MFLLINLIEIMKVYPQYLIRKMSPTREVPITRPDLTDYRIYIDVLLERLNEGAIYKMSVTDLMKLLIEKAMKNYCPDVEVVPHRKKYIVFEF